MCTKSTFKAIFKTLFQSHMDPKCHDYLCSKQAHKIARRFGRVGSPEYQAKYNYLLNNL